MKKALIFVFILLCIFSTSVAADEVKYTFVEGNKNPNFPYTVYREDGSRDFRMETKLMLQANNHANKYKYGDTYSGYAVSKFHRALDKKIKRKIREQTQRLANKL